MTRSNRSNALWLGTALAVALFLGFPTVAAAQGKTAQGTWLAAAAETGTTGSSWGRLTVKDGMLTFAATGIEWQRPLTEIKRVSESSRIDRAIEIEAVNGDKLLLSILGQQMIVESPRKALQILERAVREAPATARTAMAAAAGSGSSR